MMNRRDFIKTTGALSVAAACSGLPFQSVWAADTAAATPKKGGHLKVGMDNASSTDRLDPAFWFESYMYFVGSQLFNCLAEVDEHGKITPSLAESWETRDGSKTWVLNIRKGVQFHDGRTLTAKDVVYSLNHHRAEKSSSSVKGYLDPVVSLEATAPNQVTIKLKEPNVEFIALLSDVHFAITAENENFDKGIGTGAFILESFKPGVRTLVKRNPNHWNPARGHVDSVETLAMNDSTARVAALASGSAHLINRVNPRIVERLKHMPNIQLLRSRDSQIFTFPGLATAAPFNTLDGRLALKYAIDREQIIKTVLGGFGSIANCKPIVQSSA